LVQVDVPPVAPSARPGSELRRSWLQGVAILFLASGLLPWERWCDTPTIDVAQRCFEARPWGGSASLFGLTALVAAVIFLVMSIARRRAPSRGVGPLLAFVVMLAAATTKVVVVLLNASETTTFQDVGNPSHVGTGQAAVVVVLGSSFLIARLVRASLRDRSLVLAVVGMVAVLSVPYTMSGLAWWGGPLAPPAELGGGNGAGVRGGPGEPMFFGNLLFVRNEAPLTATLDRLEIVDAESAIRVLGTYVVAGEPCATSAVDVGVDDALFPGQCAYTLPGYRMEPGQEDRVRLAVVLSVAEPGNYRVGWFRIAYHVGQLPFEVFRTDALSIRVG